MRPTLLIGWLFLLSPATIAAQAAAPSDVASPEAVVKALYETVSRSPGVNFDWPRLRTLFLPGARMLPNPEQTGGTPVVHTVESFIRWIDDAYAANAPIGSDRDRGFAEEEVTSVVERYGDIAHVWSTYQKHLWKDPTILGRGINTIQLVFRENRWWVAAMAWDEESGAGPLPARYLP
jgi:hypothetical protein